MNRAVFFDRDGVLNELVLDEKGLRSPRCFDEFRIRDAALEIVGKVRKAGYKAIVITNQPDIARGLLAAHELDRMTKQLQERALFDDFLLCVHDNIHHCGCRKPKPGMIYYAAYRHNISLAESFVVGDTENDMGAAYHAGCKGILIDADYNQHVSCWKRIKRMQDVLDCIMKNE